MTRDRYERLRRWFADGVPPAPPPSWVRGVAIGGLIAFGVLAAAVVSGGTLRADDALELGLHSGATPRLTLLMSDLSVLGYIPTITAIVVLADLTLWRFRRRMQAAILTAIMVGEGAWDETLKLAFHRVRPELFARSSVYSFSFPSGHAFATACLLAALVALVWRRLAVPARWLTALGAAILAFGIGVSRVYLGLHYPSDVLAGWLASVAWLGAVGTWLRRRTAAT